MMGRADHYQETMRLLEHAQHFKHSDPDKVLTTLLEAQIHATLAATIDLEVLRKLLV